MIYTVTTTSLNPTTSLALLRFHEQKLDEPTGGVPVAAGPLLNTEGDHIVFLDPDGGATENLVKHLQGKQAPKEISIVAPIYGNTCDRVLHIQKNSVCGNTVLRTSSTYSKAYSSLDACLAASGPFCTGDARIEMIFTNGKSLPVITSEEDFRVECALLKARGVHRIYLSQNAAKMWISGICGPEYGTVSGATSYGPLVSNPPIPITIFSVPYTNGGKCTFPVSLARRLFGRPHVSPLAAQQHF